MQLKFTANEAQVINMRRSSVVVIEGTWGGGTMTVTMTGTTTPIRTSATANEAFSTDVKDLTFTLTGATTPDLTVRLEPIVVGG